MAGWPMIPHSCQCVPITKSLIFDSQDLLFDCGFILTGESDGCGQMLKRYTVQGTRRKVIHRFQRLTQINKKVQGTRRTVQG
jgi:hypothetical protein